MRIRLVLTIVAVLLACSVSMTWAQQQGRGGGRQGGFLRGGFPGGTSRLRLLRVEAVQTELKLKADQLASVEKVQEELQGERGQGGGQRGQGGGQRGQGGGQRAELTDQQREAFRQRAAERSAQEKEKLAGVLSAEQTARLEQIYIQQQGTQALLDADVAKQLDISATVMAKIEETSREAQGDIRSQMRDLGQAGDRQQAMAKIRELRTAADEKVLALLTPAQKEQFAKLKGPEFDMPRGARGSGGGQGGRGRANNPNN